MNNVRLHCCFHCSIIDRWRIDREPDAHAALHHTRDLSFGSTGCGCASAAVIRARAGPVFGCRRDRTQRRLRCGLHTGVSAYSTSDRVTADYRHARRKRRSAGFQPQDWRGRTRRDPRAERLRQIDADQDHHAGMLPLAREGSSVEILGRSLWNVFDLRSMLGIVSNDLMSQCTREITGFDVVLSGFFSSIGIWPNHHVTEEMREKASQVLALLEAPHLGGKPVDEMSGGELL